MLVNKKNFFQLVPQGPVKSVPRFVKVTKQNRKPENNENQNYFNASPTAGIYQTTQI